MANWGNFLMGFGKGMEDYTQKQDDLADLRSQRANNLIAQQQQQEQNQYKLSAMKDAQNAAQIQQQEAIKQKSDQSQQALDEAKLLASAKPQNQQLPQQGQQQSAQGLDPSKLSKEQLAYLSKKDPGALLNGLTDFAKTNKVDADGNTPQTATAMDRYQQLSSAGVEVDSKMIKDGVNQDAIRTNVANQLASQYRSKAAQASSLGTPEGDKEAIKYMSWANSQTEKAAAHQQSAQKAQELSFTVQKKELDVRQEADKTVSNEVNNVNSSNYDSWYSNAVKNPILAPILKATGAKGTWSQDGDKIELIKKNSEIGLKQSQQQIQKDQQDLSRDKFSYDKQQDAKEEQTKQVLQKAVTPDPIVVKQNTEKGIPTVKFSTTGDTKTDLKVIQDVRKNNSKEQQMADKFVDSAKNVKTDAQKMMSLLKDPNLRTGTAWAAASDSADKGMLTRELVAKLSPQQQEFLKISNELVGHMIAANSGSGIRMGIGMGNLYQAGKPNLSLGLKANNAMVNDLYVETADHLNEQDFINDFAQGNPNIPRSKGKQFWEKYRQDVPLYITDPKTFQRVPNPEARTTSIQKYLSNNSLLGE